MIIMTVSAKDLVPQSQNFNIFIYIKTFDRPI